MAKNDSKNSSKDAANTHPGSSPEDAKAASGKGDFGVREGDVAERTYVSENTKASDPGSAPQRSGGDGGRTSGVGGNSSGAGSSSGGDLDTDIVGVGTRGGVAASGKIHQPPGPDDATGTSADFASGPPAAGTQPAKAPAAKPGAFVQQPDERDGGPTGADAASAFQGDDASAGEVSSSEASGENDAGG